VNLYAAAVFYPGRAYDQYTDVLAVGMITTVMLWTGRRGGRRGMAGLALALAVEVLKAPIGGIPLTEIDWAVVATRMLWVLAGVIVAVGVVRVLLDYAERAERLRLEDEMLDEARRSHDSYKAALRAITNILAERDGDRALDTVRQLAMDALDPAPAAEAGTVEDVIAAAARQGRAARPAMEFKLVDAARQEIHLTEPARLRHAIENLCVNAALHSRGSRTTIHWSLTPAGLEVSVRDDGIGMKSSGGAGIGLARRQVAAVGGDLYRREVHPWTNWIVRLPASAFKAG
jgi:signal transduction histidine kinase